jgi:hypothetical protein
MPASPARRTIQATPARTRRNPAAADLDRRRRSQHFARRRRDLLEDAVAAFLITLLAITLTAGLGVIALIEIPVSLALVGSHLLGRLRHSRNTRVRSPARHARRTRPGDNPRKRIASSEGPRKARGD